MQSGWLRRSVAAREPRNKRITFHFKDDAGRDIQNERDVDATSATGRKLAKAFPDDSSVLANLTATLDGGGVQVDVPWADRDLLKKWRPGRCRPGASWEPRGDMGAPDRCRLPEARGHDLQRALDPLPLPPLVLLQQHRSQLGQRVRAVDKHVEDDLAVFDREPEELRLPLLCASRRSAVWS